MSKVQEALEAAHKREVEELNSVIQAQRSAFDAEQDRQRRAASGNAAVMRETLEELVANIETRASAFDIFSIIDRKTFLDAKAALAVPPHEAKWTANGGYEFACCSNCGHLQYAGWDSRHEQAEKIGDFHELYKFCPNCGVQMKGENDGE